LGFGIWNSGFGIWNFPKGLGLRSSFFLCLIVLAISCRGTDEPTSEIVRGGRLVAAQVSGPKTFNPLFVDDSDSLTVAGCIQATLIRINRQTQQTELDLAESADYTGDGRTLTVRLRPDLRFSDGHPLTADDVVFTFQVIYDPRIPSSVADILKVGGQRIRVEKVDDRTTRFTFPEATAAALRLFDAVYVLPRHILEPIYREGKFEAGWGLSTPPEQVVTPGPFRLQGYEPGQRTVLVRNPYYWKRDDQGRALPYLDEIELVIIPDKSTQLLKFQQGELDVLPAIRTEDVQALQPLVETGVADTLDLGPSLIAELLWFNLNPGRQAQSGKPYVDPVKLKWFSQVKFRQAIATAIDRAAIVDVVFSGKATPLLTVVSPGETQWHHPGVRPYAYNPNQAARMLDQIGLRDHDGNGTREDEQGNPVKFTLITNAGNVLREKMGLLIQEDLKQIGIEVNFVPVESKTLLGKISTDFDYEACLFSLFGGDTDPNPKSNFLLSSGNLHYWYPLQPAPATPWEAEIDELMAKQATTLDRAERKRLFDRVQQIIAEQVPVIPLVARNLLVAARRRVGNLKPGILYDYVLWNAEELYLR
jgi:peptide/nickel transport system substrate-binding protein